MFCSMWSCHQPQALNHSLFLLVFNLYLYSRGHWGATLIYNIESITKDKIKGKKITTTKNNKTHKYTGSNSKMPVFWFLFSLYIPCCSMLFSPSFISSSSLYLHSSNTISSLSLFPSLLCCIFSCHRADINHKVILLCREWIKTEMILLLFTLKERKSV